MRGRGPVALIAYNVIVHTGCYGGELVKFKPLLDRWRQRAVPVRTAHEYAIRLNLDDAARLHALAELFPGQTVQDE